MKKILSTVFLGLLMLSQNIYSQTLSEFFRQKKTQEKYLVQQIAGLRVYVEYAQKGYSIARSGLNTIGAIKRGDLDIHQLFFSSLKKINPAIGRSVKVFEILEMELHILRQSANTIRITNKSLLLNGDEAGYLQKVYSSLKSDCEDILEQLALLLTAGELELSDDERLEQLNSLHGRMRDNLGFSTLFSQQARQLTLSRELEIKDIKQSRNVIGIREERE